MTQHLETNQNCLEQIALEYTGFYRISDGKQVEVLGGVPDNLWIKPKNDERSIPQIINQETGTYHTLSRGMNGFILHLCDVIGIETLIRYSLVKYKEK